MVPGRGPRGAPEERPGGVLSQRKVMATLPGRIRNPAMPPPPMPHARQHMNTLCKAPSAGGPEWSSGAFLDLTATKNKQPKGQ